MLKTLEMNSLPLSYSWGDLVLRVLFIFQIRASSASGISKAETVSFLDTLHVSLKGPLFLFFRQFEILTIGFETIEKIN